MSAHVLWRCAAASVLISLRIITHADPFLNDETFLLSQLSLEENGATGNKGLAGILGNPVIATSVAGLATSATAFAAIEVHPAVIVQTGFVCLGLLLASMTCPLMVRPSIHLVSISSRVYISTMSGLQRKLLWERRKNIVEVCCSLAAFDAHCGCARCTQAAPCCQRAQRHAST
jgi:hypothetical protein